MAMVGDSRMRDLFYQLATLIDSKYDSNNPKIHADIQFQDKESNIVLEFFWRPLPNESMHKLFVQWSESDESAPHVIMLSIAMVRDISYQLSISV